MVNRRDAFASLLFSFGNFQRCTIFIILSTFISFITIVYIDRQKTISLECNNMLLPGALETTNIEIINDIKHNSSKECFWSLCPLYENESTIYYAFTGNQYDEIDINLCSGQFFKHPDTKNAIVGQNVETLKDKNKEYIVFESLEYEVIGKIGHIDNSLVQNAVFINDDSIYTSSYSTFYICSPNNNFLENLKTKYNLNTADKSINKWINWNQILSLIISIEGILLFFTSIMIGDMFYHSQKNINIYLLQLGIKKSILIYKDILIYSFFILMIEIFFIKALFINAFIYFLNYFQLLLIPIIVYLLKHRRENLYENCI